MKVQTLSSGKIEFKDLGLALADTAIKYRVQRTNGSQEWMTYAEASAISTIRVVALDQTPYKGDNNIRVLSLAEAGFPINPSTISSLFAWWKSDGLSFTDGAAVSLWSDSSGNGRDLTGTTTTRPLYHTSGVNGLPAVTFDGTDDMLVTAGQAIPASCTVFVLCKTTTVDGTTRALYTHAAAATWVAPFARVLLRVNGASTCLETTVDDAAVAANQAIERSTTATTFNNTWHVASMSYDQNTVQVHRNGYTAGSKGRTGAITSDTQAIYVGSSTGSVSPFKGDIAEVIVFNAALTDAQRKGITNYLLIRAGLTYSEPVPNQMMLPTGKPIKGVNIAMRHGPAAAPGPFDTQCWSDLWTQWEFSKQGVGPGAVGNWIAPQLELAKKLGCNTVHVNGSQYCRAGSGSPLTSDPSALSQTQYLARWRELMAYIRKLGLYVYAGFGSDSLICDFGTPYAWTPATPWLQAEYLAWAQMMREYTDILIGVDLATEAAQWASTSANSQPIYNLVKAVLPVSLGWSQVITSSTFNPGDANMPVPSALDHYDLHCYYNVATSDLDGFLGMGKPVLLGEFGEGVSAGTAQRATRYSSVRSLLTRQNFTGRQLAGAHSWAMIDQGTLSSDKYGMADASFQLYSDVYSQFQALPS